MPGAGGVQLRGFIVVRDRVIDLSRLGVGLGQIVVVSGKLLTRVLLFGVGMGRLQIDRFLIGIDSLLVTILLLRRIGLLVSGHAIRVAELEPQQVPGGVNVGRVLQSSDGPVKIPSITSGLGGQQLLVQRFDRHVLFLRFRLGLLLRLQLLRSQALALRLCRRFLLQINVLGEFIQADGNAAHVIHLFSIGTQERDFVFARRDAQREILTLLIEFQGVFAACIHAEPFDRAVGDRLPFGIPADALHCARGLGEHGRHTQAQHQGHQQCPRKTLFHRSLLASSIL